VNKLIQKLYYKSCQEELMVLKPGNHSIHSGIIGMNNKRFEFAAKVSGEIFINKKLDLGEKIYQSASKCFNQLGENYNLGIILLCAPIFEILPNRLSNFKAELNFVLRNINEFQGDLILRAIKESKPAGLLKYEGPGDVCKKKKLMFKKIMEIGSQRDRISKCYVNNYSEVLDGGLPFFEFLKKKTTSNNAIILLYLFYLSTNAMGSNVSAAWKVHKKGALFANPSFTQIHPTCIPVSGDYQSKLTLMSESLRNDGRIWVPKKIDDAKKIREGKLKPTDLSEDERDYYLERRYPAFGNLVPRDVASRAAKERCDAGFGVNKTGEAVFLDFSSSIIRYGKEKALIKGLDTDDINLVRSLGEQVIKAKYGNLFQMYEKIVDENPYKTPMMIYPAVHYTMGGLWVDYNLMTTIPGCYAIGEANFSDHGANRLGASALMQGLADGYFVLPYTIGDYLSKDISTGPIPNDSKEFLSAEKEVKEKIEFFVSNNGSKSVDYFHKKLGKIMWNKCGMARTKETLKEAIDDISSLRKEFYKDVKVPGSSDQFNEELAKAGRVSDFLELGELFAKDALQREESCGGHFREEYQTPEGEAKRRKEFQLDSNLKRLSKTGDSPDARTMLNIPLDYKITPEQKKKYGFK